VIQPRREAMLAAARQGYATATDLADYLVRRGLPFRDAHEVVGQAVAYGIRQNRDLAELELAELQRFSEQIGADVFTVLTLEGSVAARDHIGGTAPRQVRQAVARARARLAGE
jgi:argininosuccinate lyase